MLNAGTVHLTFTVMLSVTASKIVVASYRGFGVAVIWPGMSGAGAGVKPFASRKGSPGKQ
jgi:hypothetical protein